MDSASTVSRGQLSSALMAPASIPQPAQASSGAVSMVPVKPAPLQGMPLWPALQGMHHSRILQAQIHGQKPGLGRSTSEWN